jgi:hypothetical protein
VLVLTTQAGEIFSSENGVDWSKRTNPSRKGISATAFGRHRFVGVGADGSTIYSPDGTNWTSGTTIATNHLRGVTAKGDRFTAVGINGIILSSSEGADWQVEDSKFSGALLSVAQDGETFLCVGESGAILQSASRTSPMVEASLLDSTFRLRLDAAGWSNSQLQVSGDLINWFAAGSLTDATLKTNVMSSGNQFFRVRCLP